MKQPTLLLALTLSLVAVGCIDTKDVGVESDTNAQDTTMSMSSTSEVGSETSEGKTSESDTSEDSGTIETDSATTGGEDSGDSGIETTGDTDSGSETTGSTGGFGDEQDLCEATGGIWDPGTCGHYACGFPQDCAAVIPGCDCGIFDTFQPKVGCFPSPECEPAEFPCGESTCLAGAEYCDVTFPGPKGPTIYECADVPKACADDYTCGCLDAEGLVEPGECVQGEDLGITVTTAKP